MIFNAATNPIGALTGLTHGRVCERPDLRALVSGSSTRARRSPPRRASLDADPEELIDHAARPDVAYGHKASMLQDVEARRATEIDYLNGGIARFGRELGVPTPLHDAVTALIKGLSFMAAVGRPHDGTGPALRQRPVGDGGARARRARRLGQRVLGLRGAVTYLTGFQIVHRYAYTVVPPTASRSSSSRPEARYVGEHGTALIEQRFDPHPGAAIAAAAKDAGWQRSASTGSTT